MWASRGLSRRVVTTAYPAAPERAPGVTPGRPVATEGPPALAEVCPTGALTHRDGTVEVELGRCVTCLRCRRSDAGPMRWQDDFAWATARPGTQLPGKAFRHSLHVRVVDAGDCGACLREIRQLTGPYYAVHRLGIFFTPTPRDADVLLVVGPVTQGMRRAVVDTYEAMAEPKWVMAVGSAAATGVPFGPSFTAAGGIGDILPVSLVVPGCPPPPLAILNGLITLTGLREPQAALAEELIP